MDTGHWRLQWTLDTGYYSGHWRLETARPQKKRTTKENLVKRSGERNMEAGFRYNWKKMEVAPPGATRHCTSSLFTKCNDDRQILITSTTIQDKATCSARH